MGNKSGYTSVGKTAQDKAMKFQDVIRPHGWLSKYTYDPETKITSVFSRRNTTETIEILWHGVSCITPPTYTLAGEPIKLRNVSAAVSVATKPIDTSRLNKSIKRKTRKVPGLGSALGDPMRAPGTPVPADPISSASEALGLARDSDGELRSRLTGREIAWVNSISGNVEQGYVNSIKKIVRNGHDYVEFTDRNGFHAVHIDKIVSVG